MKAAQRIAFWADKLRDLSASGLRFSKDLHDQENYRAIQDIAMQMLALASDELLAAIEPLRAPIFDRPTPFSVGDAAVINPAGEILLIRRADSKRWAMPGGALSVGETPAEGVVREAYEETGVRCRPGQLVGVYDVRSSGQETRHHLYIFVFLCWPLNGEAPEPVVHPMEVCGRGWFAEDALPDPLEPGHGRRIRDAFRAWHGEQRAVFDQFR